MLQVESFEDLQKDVGIAIHKPFYCSLHPGESVKFFCIGCQVRFVLLTCYCFLFEQFSASEWLCLCYSGVSVLFCFFFCCFCVSRSDMLIV